MKRSEMEDVIINALRDINPEYMEKHSTYSCRLDARHILDAIEEAGMLPPYREKTSEEMERIDAINQYLYTHNWEQE